MLDQPRGSCPDRKGHQNCEQKFYEQIDHPKLLQDTVLSPLPELRILVLPENS